MHGVCVFVSNRYLIIQVHCPADYRAWLLSMYTLFGTKWDKLYCGPMLSYAPIMQAPDSPCVPVDGLHPTKVGVLIFDYIICSYMYSGPSEIGTLYNKLVHKGHCLRSQKLHAL